MKKLAVLVLAASVAGLAYAPAAGQGLPPPPSPPRAPGNDTPVVKGTASITGRVTSAASGRPLRRAQIRISATELGQARSASTDIEGMYEFTELPAGRYTITVALSGHLRTQHGQLRYGEPGAPLQVGEGQQVEKVDFALQRAGVISGRIADETGDPLSGVLIFPMQMQYYQGRRNLVPMTGAGRSDDTGQYRLLGVPPGDYILMAASREKWVDDVDPEKMHAFARTYFPGTGSLAAAQRVRVGPGEELRQVDFNMVEGATAKISGTAMGEDGTPLAGAMVTMTQEYMGPGGGMMMAGFGGARVAPDGTWLIRDVTPGAYRVRVTSANRDQAAQTAWATIQVDGADVTGLALVADSGGIVAGEVVAEGGAALPSTGAAIRVQIQKSTPDMSSSPRPSPEHDGVVRADGSFSIRAASGPAFARVLALPSGWAVKGVEVDGREHIDVPFDVPGGGRLDGVRITVSNSFPSVSGRVTDEKGAAVNCSVLLFPVEAERWEGAAGSTRVTRPDQAGLYRFDRIRPGDYLLVALDSVQTWQVNDPEFLEARRADATRITLSGAEAQVITLQVTR